MPAGQTGSPLMTARANELFHRLNAAGGLKVLAQPALVTTIGQPAHMLSGGEFPVWIPAKGGHSEIQWREFGIRCMAVVTPTGEADQLQLNTQVDVSERDYKNAVTTAAGSVVPGVSSRRVSTCVKLHNDETMILGGLVVRQGESDGTKGATADSTLVLMVSLSRERPGH